MEKILKIFKKKYSILSRQNPKRHFFKDIFEFEDFLLEKFLLVENECRILAQDLWIKVFELIKEDARYSSAKHYFIKNNFWPKIENFFWRRSTLYILLCFTNFYYFSLKKIS